MTIQQTLESAAQHHQAGQLQQAESLYRQVLAQQPNHPQALHLLGILAHQQNRPEVAADLIRRSIALQPDVAEAHYNLGLLYQQQNQIEGAIASYRRALALQPNLVKAHINLGSALRSSGQLPQAITSYQTAVALQPNLVLAHYNLANALQAAGQLENSIAAYRRVLSLKPDHSEAHNNLGRVLQTQNQIEPAIASYRAALFHDPSNAEAHYNLGLVQYQQNQISDAIAAFTRALALNPNHAAAHVNLANAAKAQNRLPDAIAGYRRAISLAPSLFEAHNNLAHALKLTGDLDDAIATYQHALTIVPHDASATEGLASALLAAGQLDQAIAVYRDFLRVRPHDAAVHSNLVYIRHFDPSAGPQTLLDEQRAWNRAHAEPLRARIKPPTNSPDPNRRLRIGYVSGDLRDHIVGHNLLPLLRAHDRAALEIFCYSNVKSPDAYTDQHRAAADHWRDIWAVPDDQAAELIRNDSIDILVDLSLHSAANRLLVFAQKPAPVQATFMGYPGGTGMDTIDYRLTDPHLDPPGVTGVHYAEKSLRLPSTFWCYQPVDSASNDHPQPNALPALAAGRITFGSLNNFCKINAAVLELWSLVLTAVLNSRLLMLVPRGSARKRVQDKFRAHGIDRARIDFTEHQPRREYLREYHRIDISLDCLPYNGHTTSLDSLWMGVPVITQVGPTVAGRAGYSQLCNLNLQELSAQSEKQFVQIATALAADLPRLADLRRTLRDRMRSSPLMNLPQFARDIESAYRNMWTEWCNNR